MSPATVCARRPGTETTRLGTDFVVLDAQGQTLRGLNATGARVFELIDGRAPASGIAAQIAAEFAVSAERALTDVLAFLQLLTARGLVEVLPGGPPHPALSSEEVTR